MLEQLTLENFQAHKKLTIKFGRITVVRGDSDIGKSAIIRALGWVMFNRPDGDDFVNWDADTAVVTLEVDGQIIVRSRGKKENGYLLNGDEFAAFGKGVPERVAELLRVSDVNFQSQFDSPFWLSESAGEVSRRLNHVINLGIIDTTLANVVQRVRKTKATVEVCEDRIKAAKKTRDELRFAVDMDEALVGVELAYHNSDVAAKKLLSLQTTLEAIRTANRQKKALQREAADGLALAEAYKTAFDLEQRAQLLHEVIISAELLRKASQVKLPDLKPLTALKDAYEDVAKRRAALDETLETMRGLWRRRRDATAEAKAAHDELHEKMKGACPVCGHEMK